MSAPTTQDDILYGTAYFGADGVMRQVSDLPVRTMPAPPVTARALADALASVQQDYVVRQCPSTGVTQWWPAGESPKPLGTDELIAELRARGVLS